VSRRLFAVQGFASTTVRDIAGECGISDAAIFYHFPEKSDILQTLLLQGIELPTTPIESPPPGATTLAERIVDEALLIIDQNRDLLRIVIQEALAGDISSRDRYEDWLEFWEGRLAPVIETRSCRGSADANRVLARQILLLVVMAAEDRLLLRRDSSIPQIRRMEDLRMFLIRAVGRLLE
jgi:AcrR family transcriptional regulator